AQPGTLQAGLVAATQSTDTLAPLAAITSPAAGANVTGGQAVTISGTATDSGGGQVAGIEGSVDNGATWQPATGRGTWTYAWTPSIPGSVTIRARAVDDSGNLQTAAVTRTVTVGAQACPCTGWDNTVVPNNPADSDVGPLELGVKFRTDVA